MIVIKQLLLFLSLTLLSTSSYSEPVDIARVTATAIGQHAQFLKEDEGRLQLNDAINAYNAGKFTAATTPVMTFAIGSDPVWVRFDATNNTGTPLTRNISIETSWLDNIEIYFITSKGLLSHREAGDSFPFKQRTSNSRYFVFEHLFAPGTTSIYIRTETPDPLVLPIYLNTNDTLHARDVNRSYAYGLIYGVMLTLIFYNLMLYLGLKGNRYLYYSIYLTFFVLTNLSYTGHAFEWLWPESPTIQIWGNPVLMVAYGISGLLFAINFLDTKLAFPQLHRITLITCLAFAIAIALSVLSNSPVAALLLAFSFVLLFTFGMVVLGTLSFYIGNQSAKYFIYGSLIAALSATITALAVWGYIPFTQYTYRAIEIGTVFEAILLALALADRLYHTQEDKLAAEQMARIDPLTGLNNRRAFSELTEPMWNTCIRKHHDISVVLLDIDTFKNINDSFGHTHGDKVLVHTAKALAQSARAGDILARWGGEEFILFMPETTLSDAIAVAERMCKKISTIQFELNGEMVSFTASFGVANCTTDLNTLDKLISAADNYLYLAKERGRNRVCSPRDKSVATSLQTHPVVES